MLIFVCLNSLQRISNLQLILPMLKILENFDIPILLIFFNFDITLADNCVIFKVILTIFLCKTQKSLSDILHKTISFKNHLVHQRS